MRHARVLLVLACTLLPLPFACGGSTAAPLDGGPGGSDDAGDDTQPEAHEDELTPPAPADKLDLLFMIDNSASMGDKQALLARAVPDMIGRLVNPNCLDPQGHVIAPSQNGHCADGVLEFRPVHDMHIGVVTSSIGSQGADTCDPNAKNPANPSLAAHNDDRGHLIDRAGADEHTVADAVPSNFLAWFPTVPENQGQPQPPVPAITDAPKLVGDFQDLVSGVHEHGCGFEAQMESWYRFLVQPDPYDTIQKIGTRAQLQGVDATVLQQRHDFLRPDSAVAVVVITDENEEIVDPIAIGSQGWTFLNSSFPGSPNGAAPRGSIECQSNPLDPNCTSCAFIQNDPNFATRCPGGAYLDPADDNLNVRSFHTKQRFGLWDQFPVSRYLTGLSSDRVPDSAHEHDNQGAYVGDTNANCTNPLFARSLPQNASQELCNLPRGPRSSSQVFYAVIGGVPHQLLQVDPSNPDSPQMATLGKAEWDRILGHDPLSYDFSGADFHMLESEGPRAGSNCPPGAADTCDPINGREWDTQKGDVQWACVFDLVQPKDCNQPQYAGACDCATGAYARDTPLCENSPGDPSADQRGYTNMQIRGKAYPSIRELALARALGGRSAVSSICPIHVVEKSPGDPLFGYRPAMQALIDRIGGALAH